MTTDEQDHEMDNAPTTDPTDEPIDDGQTFDANYVRRLRDEAAEHRRARREAETAVDTLTAEMTEMRAADDDRQVAERLADVMADPSDVWSFVDRAEVTNDDGRVDLDAVEQRARDLTEQKRHLAKPARPVSADQGIRGQHVTPAPTWSDVLQQS